MEWAEFDVPHGYKRDFDDTFLEAKEVLTVIGARRTGKTFLCYQMIRKLRETLPRDNVIYVNLEDERLHPLKGDELTVLWDICQEIFHINKDQRVYLFVDEVQNVDNWSKWVRRMADQNENIKLVITGSSAKLLSREIATELRGRTLSVKLFPLSFKEYLGVKGVSVDLRQILYSRDRPLVKKHFNEYLLTGGFPAVVDSKRSTDLLREYYNVMFYRDLVERNRISNLRLMEDYLALLVDQISCHFSVYMTGKKLNEMGYSFSKTTLSNFSKYAQDAFLSFEVKKYCFKIREQMRATKKIYIIDHGLAQAVRFAFQDNVGRMLENIAYIELQRRAADVYYHKAEKECDFLTVQGGKVISALQVTKSISAEITKQREIAGAEEAMADYRIKEALVLTENENTDVKTDSGFVRIVPLWYWLLDK